MMWKHWLTVVLGAAFEVSCGRIHANLWAGWITGAAVYLSTLIRASRSPRRNRLCCVQIRTLGTTSVGMLFLVNQLAG